MQNPFDNPGFSMASLTAAINLLPNRYGRLEQLGLFPARPVRTRQIVVEERNGALSLLPTQTLGGPATLNVRDKRKLRSFVVPHVPLDDVVLPEEVQGVRASVPKRRWNRLQVSSRNTFRACATSMRSIHWSTCAWALLKGVILDADGLGDSQPVRRLRDSGEDG